MIYGELCRGEIRPESRQLFLEIIEALRRQGAEGIILGCTEIPLLIEPRHCSLPLFNTALLHAAKALDFALLNGAVKPSASVPTDDVGQKNFSKARLSEPTRPFDGPEIVRQI